MKLKSKNSERRKTFQFSMLGVFAVPALLFQSAGFGDEKIEVTEISAFDSEVNLIYLPQEGYYYILDRGDNLELIAESIDISMAPANKLTDQDGTARKQSFYRVRKIAIENSLDSDGDGIKDVDELRHSTILDPLNSEDAVLDFDNDGRTNRQELTDPDGATDPGDAGFENIEFKTADDFTISASLGIPGTATPSMSAVIFIHQGGSTRKEWEAVAKKAFREGWITLAYDIRGHGASSGTWNNAWYNDPQNAPEDLKAAIEYLKGIPKVDSKRIAVVGSSVGGNLACVASALYEVKTSVAISHKSSAIFNLAGARSLNFRSIYHISSEGDGGGQRKQWATELYQQTAVPKKLEITKGSAHGVSVFNTDGTIPDRIIQWLRDTL